MDRAELLTQAKSRLKEAFGERCRGLVLYGSEARGEAAPDSDVDLLVLLDGPVDLGDDLRTAIKALYDLVLEFERPIHAQPVDLKEYEAADFALYRNAKREGIAV